MNTEQLKDAFSQMLSKHDWDLWITVTSREPMDAEVAKRRLKNVLKFLNTPERRFYSKYLWLWAFFENNASRNGIHIHALVDGISTVESKNLQNIFQDYFGLSSVAPVHDNVLPYLSQKYANGTALADFDYMKINSNLR